MSVVDAFRHVVVAYLSSTPTDEEKASALSDFDHSLKLEVNRVEDSQLIDVLRSEIALHPRASINPSAWSELLERCFYVSRKYQVQELTDLLAEARMTSLVDIGHAYASAILWARQCLEFVSPLTKVILHGDAAIAHIWLSQFDLADGHIALGLSQAADLGAIYWIARLRANRSALYARQARFREALQEVDAALEIGARLESFDLEGKLLNDRQTLLAAIGE